MTNIEEPLPCPFCGGKLEIAKHFKEEIWRAMHSCRVVGVIEFGWTEDAGRIVARWNTRHIHS